MDMYINIAFTALLISGLVIIYRKKDENESLLFIKLLLYYLLGSFRFNYNELAIPLGFIIYPIVSHPKSNTRIKRYAAILGLIFFFIGLAIPSISKYIYERPKAVPISTMNINKIDFQKDWELIKEKLEINDDTRIEYVNIEYENGGTIKVFRYQLITQKEEGLVHYSVELYPEKRKFIILPSKIKQWAQCGRLTTAKRFFEHISFLNLADIRSSGLCQWYVISSTGDIFYYAIKENSKFLIISKDNVRKINNDELLIKGFVISSYEMEKVSDTGYMGGERKDYFYDVIKD